VITLEALNTLPVDEFASTLGAIFEHSPWVPQRAAAARPFASRLGLLDAMRAVVQAAPVEEQLGLIRAHPQLGARGRKRAQLTDASSSEQRRAGLDACTDEEFAQLLRLNTAYEQKFSFPFILAVRGHDPNSILASMGSRLNNDPEFERHTALTQIGLIGGYRLADVVASPAAVEIEAMSDRLPPAARDAGFTQASAAIAASLLREWMLAANLDLYMGPDGSLAGIQQHDPHATYLLTGAYTDPADGSLRRDRGLGSLTGIVVAQQLRQKNLAPRFNLCVLATSGTPDSDPLAPLRSAGLNPRYEVYAREPTAAAERPGELPDTNTLERAARALENFLTTQPSKIQE
jgi:beta-ureidopropionase / N-carbamoyl-L-amino-acid hydrolase